MLKQLPNALTLLRLILAPVIAWLFWMAKEPLAASMPYDAWMKQGANYLTLAAVLFVVAALTDFFDGMIARALDAHSKFGRLIDPIADKALVGLPLIALSLDAWQSNQTVWPVIAGATAVIVVRDVGMTLLRLFAPDGEGARVSSLAKIKTALELFVIGSFLVAAAILTQIRANDPNDSFVLPYPASTYVGIAWIGLLVVTAALSAWTAFQYLAPKRRT